MKKLIFSILLIWLVYPVVLAQNRVFNFNAADKGSIIDSIRAINLTTGESVLVKGINQITFTSTSVNKNLIPESISIYPNPSFEQTEMQFYSSQNDDIKIILVNTAGQIVASEKYKLEPGHYKFKITTGLNGMYLLKVTGDNINFSRKIITTGNYHNINKIQHVGLISKNTLKKSAVMDDPDVIHFFIYSGDKITKIADTPTESKTYEVKFIECKDPDEKNYPIVQIGEQWWMAENLAYLPSVSSPSRDSDTEPYYYVYDNEGTSISTAKARQIYNTYGVLYNWPAALEACPGGWHLPSDDEWEQIAQYVSDQNGGYGKSGDDWYDVGKHLKATGTIDYGDGLWQKESAGVEGTDDIGFSGLPGGYRYPYNYFDDLGINGNWWSSTEYDKATAWSRALGSITTKFGRTNFDKNLGFSVRCVKD